MKHTKRKQHILNKIFMKIRCHKLLMGGILIGAGVILSLDLSFSREAPTWIHMGPVISIYTERIGENISIICEVDDNGNIDIGLTKADNRSEKVRVWIYVNEFPSLSFQWRVNNIDNVILVPANANDLQDYPAERTFLSLKTGYLEGQTQDTELFPMRIFTVEIEPGKAGYQMRIMMNPEKLEYQNGGEIMIRLPVIMAGRNMPLYDMEVGDFIDFMGSGETNLAPLFSECMIDGNLLFTPDLNISASYASKYYLGPDCLVSSVMPEPIMLDPYIAWEEKLQWAPSVSLRNLKYDRGIICKNIIGGILTAIGSSIVIIPISKWLHHHT